MATLVVVLEAGPALPPSLPPCGSTSLTEVAEMLVMSLAYVRLACKNRHGSMGAVVQPASCELAQKNPLCSFLTSMVFEAGSSAFKLQL